MILASHALPRPSDHSFERKVQKRKKGAIRSAADLPPVSAFVEFYSYDPVSGIIVNKPRFRREDCGIFTVVAWNRRYAGIRAGGKRLDGYRVIDGKFGPIAEHWVCWALHYGVWPCIDGAEVDHINRVRDDNRLENLRLVRPIENQWNKGLSSTNTSGYTGVFLCRKTGRWRAVICVGKRHIHLGGFDTVEEAAAARHAAAVRLGRVPNHGGA